MAALLKFVIINISTKGYVALKDRYMESSDLQTRRPLESKFDRQTIKYGCRFSISSSLRLKMFYFPI